MHNIPAIEDQNTEFKVSFNTGVIESLVAFMQQNPSVSAQRLSEEIGISKRKIEENIRTLRERNKIERIGNAKSGHWEVLE